MEAAGGDGPPVPRPAGIAALLAQVARTRKPLVQPNAARTAGAWRQRTQEVLLALGEEPVGVGPPRRAGGRPPTMAQWARGPAPPEPPPQCSAWAVAAVAAWAAAVMVAACRPWLRVATPGS
jgi:hypothetical protein